MRLVNRAAEIHKIIIYLFPKFFTIVKDYDFQRGNGHRIFKISGIRHDVFSLNSGFVFFCLLNCRFYDWIRDKYSILDSDTSREF